MSKELIVSVNGREKKIAIIENERVTEFYIERGDENQGIVGNIYKGRVMRVLPGMQSAFVDIGLERDAFLYVSDFFDEEEEFERIVMDKAKKGDRSEAERAANDRIEMSRIEREHKMDATQERAEPIVESVTPTVVASTDKHVEAATTKPAVSVAEAADEAAGKRRGRRGRRRGKGSFETTTAESSLESGEVASRLPELDIDTPFVAGDSSFQRVVDEEERAAAEDGAMFKDARLQERIFNQIHAVEFDIDETGTAEVGSLINSVGTSSAASFQRVDDSDVAGVYSATSDGPLQLRPVVAARVDAFVDEVIDESPTRSFERVSDEERVGSGVDSAEAPAKRARGAKKGATKAPAKKPTKTRKPASGKTAAKASAKGRKPKAAPDDSTGASADASTIDNPEDANSFADEYQDGDASVSTASSRGEFATRRGGRRRRRKPADSNVEEESRTNGKDEEAVIAVEAEEPEAAPAAPATPAAPREPSAKRERGRRPRPGNGRPSRRDPRNQPTITDLLREGQEILVQIAKEPIAKKGARITSHIALPGRFLVYMPTVEHVGVSRKIESDSERVRLRKLIQSIRAEEDVPSGGFIVRTAGTGISEEDLRNDARYLVRTWLEIRKSAEKVKAPAVAHQDLDLVERILRDQLSDDFAAIRVDSEEEYQRIVEFINRIQPKMVKRVKLHTRDEPILETYGVQAEIDKAIKPRVWLKSGGYLVINQTEALVAIDVNTGKFVGRGGTRLEDTITRTNMEAVDEIVRQIRLRDLGGIIVLDLIDMEDRRNRARVMQALQEALHGDKSPTKVLAFNDFGLVIMTRKRVKQSLERTLCAPCPYCQGAGLVKSPQTICYEILEEARRLSKGMEDEAKQITLRVNSEVARSLRGTEREILNEIEMYLGAVDVTTDKGVHQEQFDFAFI